MFNMKNKIFENINGYPLDEEQQQAAMSNARFNMIIAGAGSGKTLTMIGKIKYLLEIKHIPPEEIVCISFTNEAVNSLKAKIQNEKIKVFTFHKLAIYFLNKEDYFYELIDESYLSTVIDTFFNQENLSIYLKKAIKKAYKIKIYTAKKIKNSPKYLENKKIIQSFINLYQANNLKKTDLKNLLQQKNSALLLIIFAVITYYENEKQKNHYLDFDDLIKKATQIVKNKKIAIQEMIIDEFQDTSLLRLDFVKEIINSSGAHLTVVGDDFQSIYRFSGCDLDIFLNFQKNFPNAITYKIQTTYRNSNELIEIAGNFVMKNKAQLQKKLKSNKHLTHPIQIVSFINRYHGLLKTIKKIKTGEILILGRNNFDIYKYIPKEKIKWEKNGYFYLENYDFQLRYLTIHKSKGLESENVIIINLENDLLGFPSKKKNVDPINLIEKKDDFLFEEERRLFYVALTRTKNYCYLLVPYINASIFAKEIKKMV